MLIYHTASSQKSETRPNSSHYNQPQQQQLQQQQQPQLQRSGAMPPTPPMSSDASFDAYSPTAKAVHQMPPQNYYFDASPQMSHVESEAHRQQMIPRIPVQPTYAPAYAPSYMSPAMGSYYPTMQPTPPPQPQVSGLYFQRPLPQVSIDHHLPIHPTP